MAPFEESDEEYLDDPIRIIDIDCKREPTETFDLTDGDLCIQTNNDVPPKLLEKTRNINLLKVCKPLSIKLVNCDFWYPKKVINNDSDTEKEVDFYNKKSDDNKMFQKEEERIRLIKIRPVVSPYEHLVDSPKSNTLTKEKSLSLERKRKNPSKLQDIFNDNNFNSFKLENDTQVDFKKNRGLIGMKVTQTDISSKDVEKTKIKKKSKSSNTNTKPKNRTEKKYCTIQDVNKMAGKQIEDTGKITSLNKNVTKMLDVVDKSLKKNATVAEKKQTSMKKDYDGIRVCIKVPASFNLGSVTKNPIVVGKNPDCLVKFYNVEPEISNVSGKKSKDSTDNLSQKCISDLKMRVNKTIDDKTATIKDDLFFSEKKIDLSNNSSNNQRLIHTKDSAIPNKNKQSNTPSNVKNVEVVKDIVDKLKKKKDKKKKSNNIETTILSDIGSNLNFHVVSAKEDIKTNKKSMKIDKTKPKKIKIKVVKSVAESNKCSSDDSTHKKQNKCIKREVSKKIGDRQKSTQSGNNNNVEIASSKTMTTINLHKDLVPNSNEYCKKNQDLEKSAISNTNTFDCLIPGVDNSKSSSFCIDTYAKLLRTSPHHNNSTLMENSINSDHNVPVIQKFYMSNDLKKYISSVEEKSAPQANAATITLGEPISLDNVPNSRSQSAAKHSSSDTASINNQPNEVLRNNMPLNIGQEQKSCSKILKITRVNPAVDNLSSTNSKCNTICSNSTTFPSNHIFNENKTCNIPSAPPVRTSITTAHPTQTLMSTSDNISKQNHCSSQQNGSTPSMKTISHLYSVAQQLSRKPPRTQSNGEQPPMPVSQQKIQPTSNTQAGCYYSKAAVSQYTKEDRLPPTCDIAMFKEVPNDLTLDLNAQNMSLESGQLLTPPSHVNLQPAPNPTDSRKHSFLPNFLDPRQRPYPPNPLILGQQLVSQNPSNLRQQLPSSNSPIPRQQLAPPLSIRAPHPSIRAPHPSDLRQQMQFFNKQLNVNSGMSYNNPQHFGTYPQSNVFPFGHDQSFRQEFANLDQPYLHNIVHCAPVYDGLPKNVNNANLYGMQNYWGGYYNPTMPPPYYERFKGPEQGTNQKLNPYQQTNNASSTPKRISGKTIIGCNDKGPIRKINICEPVDICSKMVNGKTHQLAEQVPTVRSTKDSLENKNVSSKQKMIPQSTKTIAESEKNDSGKKNKSKPLKNNKEITCDKEIVASKKEMLEELSKLTTESSESSAKVSKRTSSKTAVNEEIPHPMDKIKRPKPGPLSSKTRLNTTISQQKVIETSLAHKGYSPPILPILTYEELLAKSNMTGTTTDLVGHENEKETLNTVHASNFAKRTDALEEKHVNLSKKISLGEYKKRSSKHEDKNGLEKIYDLLVNNKLGIRSENVEDLGYGSDSTTKV